MTFSNNTCCCVWLMRLESYLLSTWRWLFAYTYANCGKPLRAHLHFAMNVFNCILCGCGFFINIQHLIIIIIILLKYFIYFCIDIMANAFTMLRFNEIHWQRQHKGIGSILSARDSRVDSHNLYTKLSSNWRFSPNHGKFNFHFEMGDNERKNRKLLRRVAKLRIGLFPSSGLNFLFPLGWEIFGAYSSFHQF